MPCDHPNVITPFCPQCGTRVNKPHPLESLLAHVTARATVLREHKKTLLAKNYEKEEQSTLQKRLVEEARCDANIEKWTVWQNALEEVLAPEPEAPVE